MPAESWSLKIHRYLWAAQKSKSCLQIIPHYFTKLDRISWVASLLLCSLRSDKFTEVEFFWQLLTLPIILSETKAKVVPSFCCKLYKCQHMTGHHLKWFKISVWSNFCLYNIRQFFLSVFIFGKDSWHLVSQLPLLEVYLILECQNKLLEAPAWQLP